MIVNGKHANVETVGIEESINMTIDTSDQAALMAILSENLYKDPIGSLVRESASNALDAQKAAGNTDPIIVRLNQDKSYNYVFSVTDFGTGISPTAVRDVLSKYAASTKRGSNDYLGYYGLGFKAPLAYTDSFTFTTIYEGIEYGYIMYKGEEGTKIDLISEGPSKEGSKNGTTVTIQLKTRHDYQLFVDKIKEQLAYFEGVYFAVATIDNNFKIIKGEDWKYSDLRGPRTGMHICLENVYYEIDWKRLGVPQINTPIGLIFTLNDGLMPIPSREDIKYTEETKDLLKQKIKKVANYFVEKFNETRTEADSFLDIYDKFNVTNVTIEGRTFDTTPLRTHSSVKETAISVKGIELLDLHRLSTMRNSIFEEWEGRGRIAAGTFFGRYVNPGPMDLVNRVNNTNEVTIMADRTPKGVELEYIKHLYHYANFIYKTRGVRNLGNGQNHYTYGTHHIQNYYQLLQLAQYPRSQWRQVIKEYKSIEDDILSHFVKLEDIQPTEEWLAERKANRKKSAKTEVGKQRITIKKARAAERGDKKLAFDHNVVQLKDLAKELHALNVWVENEDKEKLEEIWPIGLHKRVNFVAINKHDIKKIKGLNNFITIDEFMRGKNKPFQVFATAFLIQKLMDDQNSIFRHVKFIKLLSKDFNDKMQQLVDYVKLNKPGYTDELVINAILNIARDKNLFDPIIMDIYKEVKEKIHNFDFVEFLDLGEFNPERDKAFGFAKELLLYRGVKMNWENYVLPNAEILKDKDEEAELDEDDDQEEEIDASTDEPAPLAGSVAEDDIIGDIKPFESDSDDYEFQGVGDGIDFLA